MKKYIENQMLTVCPVPVEDCGQIKLKIVSDRGQTKWLNITADQFRKIENILTPEGK